MKIHPRSLSNTTTNTTTILAIASTLFSCSPEKTSGQTPEKETSSVPKLVESPGGEDKAYQSLSLLIDRTGWIVHHVDERRMPDGSFDHLRIKAGQENKLSKKLIIDSSGSIYDIKTGQEKFKEKYNKKYGNLEFSVAKWVESNPQENEKIHRFTIWYDSDQLTPEDIKQKSSADESRSAFSKSNSIATLEIRPYDAKKLAKTPGVLAVTFSSSEENKNHGVGDAGSVSSAYVGSDNDFNDREIYGSGVKVAILELISIRNSCAVFEDHEAFAFVNSISYLNTIPCTNSSQCSSCDHNGTSSVCLNNKCVDASGFDGAKHASQVMSRVASSVPDTPLHAAKVDFLVPNDGSNPNNDVELNDLFQTIRDEGAQLVNMSFGGPAGFEGADVIRDWHARYNQITIVKTTGNHADEAPTDCEALNVVCVGSTNANSTYADDFLDDTMSPSSPYLNPEYSPNHPDSSKAGNTKEAERPDVVSEGKNAKVMDVSTLGYNDWSTNSGTSFSAPVITGLLALLEEDCRRQFSPAQNRAILRTGAWRSHNLEDDPDDPAYPHPDQHPDAFAGTGISHSTGISGFCSENGEGEPENFMGNGIDDPTSDDGWLDIPEWMDSTNFPGNSEIATPATPQTYKQALRSADSKVKKVWDIGQAERVRFTFSFYTCPPSDTNGEYDASTVPDFLAPAVDYDVLLCAEDIEECITISETLDDTNEGFDVMIPVEFHEYDLSVWRVKPAGENVEPCEGPDEGMEPWSWALSVWRQ